MKDIRTLALSVIGSAHIKAKKVCQDASAVFEGGAYSAIVVSDGHGGEKHFRSDVGSKLALEVFERSIPEFVSAISKCNDEKQQCRLLRDFEKHLIMMWREEVTNELIISPFTYEELAPFSDSMRENIQNNPHIAFGATFLTAIMCHRKLFIIQLGDGDCIVQRGDLIEFPIRDDETLKFGHTTSLCDDAAYEHIRDAILPLSSIKACLVSSDGVRNSFDSSEHFTTCCNTLIDEFSNTDAVEFEEELDEFLSQLSARGSSDDVSIAIMTKA